MDAWQRISDTDRERAMTDLGTHYAEGRLEHEEYDERLDAVWTARTAADLAVVFHDLPGLPAPAPSVPARRDTRLRPWMGFLGLLLAALVVVGVLKIVPVWILVVVALIVLTKTRHRKRSCGTTRRR